MENGLKPAFVYKTTNVINGKIYIGVRTLRNDSTDDKYLGSGVAIRKSIKKYGAENFTREIIFEGSQRECYQLENDIVTSDFIKSQDNYNQRVGGQARENQYGTNNTSFKGYWYTPFGVFISSTSAAKYIGVTKYTVQRYCRTNKNKYWYFVNINDSELKITQNIIFYNPLLLDNYKFEHPCLFNENYNPMHDEAIRKKAQASQKKRPVVICGVEYISVNEAARQLGFSTQRLRHRLKSETYKDHYYISSK